MLLADTPTGVDVRVLASNGDARAVTRRLAEMGLRPGTVLHLQSRTSGGGAILAIGDDRIAVSGSILRSITVALDRAAARD